MRTLGAILCAALTMGVALRAAAEAPNAAGAADAAPLFPTREGTFDIPFQIDEPIPGQEPVEVQLHVSEDRGATWREAVKASPSAERFTFRAPHDGEFWFLVRTLNRAGRLLPDRPPAPELRVLVDTQPPTIEFDVVAEGAEQLACSWKIGDPNLRPETLEAAYQGIDAAGTWRPIPTPPSQPQPDGRMFGRVVFVPTSSTPPYFVRLEVSDAAGNRATAQRQIARPGEKAPNPTALPPTTALETSIDRRAMRPLSQSASRDADELPKTSPGLPSGRAWPAVATPLSPALPPREAVGPPPVEGVAPSVGGPPQMPRAFPGRSETLPRGESVPPAGPASANFSPPSPYAPASTPGRGTGEPAEPEPLPMPSAVLPTPESLRSPDRMPTPTPSESSSGPSLNGLGFATPSRSSVGESTGPAVPTPFVGPSSPSTPSASPVPTPPAAVTAAKPDGVQPRMVNSKRFELDYDVEAVGPAGVAKVELWSTVDGGKTWQALGVDPDSVSPYVVNVDNEGTYGFRMVIETTTGLRSAQPQPGDLPEVWVGIDVTKPSSRIKSAVAGTGSQAGELLIDWEAADDRLLPRPVALSFAERIEGPWTPIASGLPNDGHYAWRLDNRVPERLYLKLDVRDEAGNVGTFVTPEQVSLERVKPQGKIRGVRPIGVSAGLRLPAQIPPR